MALIQFLNVGDMVYLTIDKTIYQGRIDKLVTYDKLDNYINLSLHCYVKELEVKLANGRVITLEETDLYKEKGISLYPSVEELRKGWRGNKYIDHTSIKDYDNAQSKKYISNYIKKLESYGFVIDCNNIMPIFYKNDGIKVISKRIKFIVNNHNEILDDYEFEFLTNTDDAKPHSWETFRDNGWFTTYKEAYDSITPEVVMFEEPKSESKYNKNYVILDIIYNLQGETINESVFGETDKFHDAVTIASLSMHNEVNELFYYDNYTDGEEVYYHQYKVYEVENGELKYKQTPLFKTECYVKQ